MQEVVCRSTPYAMLELTAEGKVVWDQIGTLCLKQPGQTQRGSLIRGSPVMIINLVAFLKLGSEESSGKSQA